MMVAWGFVGLALFFAALGLLHREDGVDTEGMSRVLLLLMPPFALYTVFTLGGATSVALTLALSEAAGAAGTPLIPQLPFLTQLAAAAEAVAIGLLPAAAYRIGAGLPLRPKRAPAYVLLLARAPVQRAPLDGDGFAEQEWDQLYPAVILVRREPR